MDDREELAALRRMAELEAKAGGGSDYPAGDSRNGPAALTIGPEASAQPSMIAQGVDAIRSIPGGLVKGAAAIGGIPGDIDAGLTSLADWGMSKLDPETLGRMQAGRGQGPSLIPKPPTSGELGNAIAAFVGGFYEPKTTAGEYAQTISSFVPNAMSPGSMLAKGARVVVPGAASEFAGQQTKGTKWEPLARAGGAVLGGVAQGVGEGILHSRANPVLSMDELGKAKTAAYTAADQAGVQITPQAWGKFSQDIDGLINQAGLTHPKLHSNTLSALETIASEAATGQPISLSRVDVVRQVINDAVDAASGPNGNGGDLRRAMQVKGSLDDFLDNLAPTDTLAGDAAIAVPILKEARSLAQREFKAKEIQKLIDLAENQASANYSGAGVETALRQQFKGLNAKLIKNPSEAKAFSDAEREAIKAVAKGGPVGNALRLIGKLAPTGVISGGVGVGLGAYGGGLIGGPVGAAIGSAAVPALGSIARKGATLATQRNARLAEQLMRAGQANPGATTIPRNVLLGTLLSQGVTQGGK